MPQSLPKGPAALLLALVGALLLLRLGRVPLLGPDEPRYARVAVEMQRAGEWVTPTLRGEPWLEKPPLYYWLAGAAFAAFGENETAARLPSTLAALLLVGATALFGARLAGTTAGLHAGFALGTSLLVFAYGRAASMDMLLAACVTLAIGLFALRLFGIAGALAVPGAYVALGFATLAKGPLGLLLPALVVAGLAVAERDLRPLRLALHPVGILLFLAVCVPWYAAIYADQGRHFVDVFLLNHNVSRFTSTVHNHPGPVVYYLPVLLVGLFPWGSLALPALGGVRPRADAVDRLLLTWFLLPLAFFSLAGSKLPGYVLPCLPPLALLMGRAAARLQEGGAEARHGTGARAAALLGLAIAALLGSGPLLLARRGEGAAATLAPAALWAVLVAFLFARRIGPDPAGALRLLRLGGAGFLLLLTLSAPPVLARLESGRSLFLPANGREVLAFGAWRTAWMAGYFYNDGRVREVATLDEVARAAEDAPALVLSGPAQRRQIEALAGFEATALAEGPRRNVLLRLGRR